MHPFVFTDILQDYAENKSMSFILSMLSAPIVIRRDIREKLHKRGRLDKENHKESHSVAL